MPFFDSAVYLLSAATVVQGAPFLSRRAASGLNTAAVAAGKVYFGSATDNVELTDTAYLTELSNTADFGQITPGNTMKWQYTEPSQGSFDYTEGDVIANLAASNGQKLRCHTLVWYSQLPSWVSNGGFDNATLIEVMTNHITNEMMHYKGQCYAWDVVNEAISDDGTGSYRSNVFYETIGEAYIPIAFAAAAAADPDAKLYYNDYNIDYSGSKATKALEIVKMVQAYGAKIDGVGGQGHWTVGGVPTQSDLEATMKTYTDLGVDFAITELDIRMELPETDALLEQQATDYSTAVGACMNVDGCVGITIWDYTDKYSWVPNTFSGYGDACPWDDDLEKKPAYNAILSALGGSTSSNVSTVAAADTAATTPTTASQAASGAVAKYGQCGGATYSGSLECESGSTCTAFNDYYSQCL
ncbi:carbohydrate-binding module family 1 protein [Saccharata proteae CBS 121410]|uniref:Beta-xylanase n=1 Tax=Saccharata proteae CBS 121410 TaxID=1314787 RepID=A0A9P4HT29_9PEZI|nr:carbohydrate-binding module family 1 protein [Saccharata proteae CBS 121410]